MQVRALTAELEAETARADGLAAQLTDSRGAAHETSAGARALQAAKARLSEALADRDATVRAQAARLADAAAAREELLSEHAQMQELLDGSRQTVRS